MYEARYGALTELYAGISSDLSTTKNNGVLIIPWGRIGLPRLDIQEGMEGRCKKLGDIKTGEKLWEMLEGEVKPYM